MDCTICSNDCAVSINPDIAVEGFRGKGKRGVGGWRRERCRLRIERISATSASISRDFTIVDNNARDSCSRFHFREDSRDCCFL